MREHTSPGYSVSGQQNRITFHCIILDLIAPAQYWHDPFNHTDFLNGSIYLADINNERDVKRDDYKENLLRLENFVMVRWRDETTIIPAASSQFGFYLPGQVRLLVTMSHILTLVSRT